MNKTKILSLLFFTAFVISLVYTFFIKFDEISVPYFKGIRKSVQTDVIYKTEPTKVLYDDKAADIKIKIDKNHYLYGEKTYKKVKKISFQDKTSIDEVLIYNEKQVTQYKTVPDSIEINNEKNIIEKTTISFLSFFYNYKLFLISYLFLILFLSFSKLNFNHKATFILITLIAFLLRITQLNEIPFWDDEIYVLSHTAKYSKFIEMFNDPGNPPLFFIIFKIWRTIVQKEQLFRYLSVITGIIFNVVFYFYIRQWLNKSKALFAYFVAAISLMLIYFSQEIRCYMLLMLFSCVSSFLLFKYNKKTNKLYFINSVLMLNTHFYGCFLWLYNFVFGVSIFYKNKKRTKSFIINNLISFLIFIPNVIFKTKSLTSEFNAWIQKPILGDLIQVLKDFSYSMLIILLFIGVVFYCYNKTISPRQKLFIKYNSFAILSVIIFSFVFSYLIKPVFQYRYFYVVYPFYLALCICVICYNYKTIYKSFLRFLFFILFLTTGRLNTQNFYNNSDLYYNYVKQDIDSSKRNYVFFNNTVENHKNFRIGIEDKAKLIYLAVDKGMNDIDPKAYNIDFPCVCYILNLYLKENVYEKASDIKIYKTPLGVISKISYN